MTWNPPLNTKCSLYLYGRLPERIESGDSVSEKKNERVIAAYMCGIRDKWMRGKAEKQSGNRSGPEKLVLLNYPNYRHFP